MNTILLSNEDLSALRDLLSMIRVSEATSFEEYVSDHWDVEFEIAGDEDEFEHSLTDEDIEHPFKQAELLYRVIEDQLVK